MFEEGAERTKALGIWGGLGAAAGTTGLIAGGILTKYAGWQSIFYLNVPIGVLALALAPRIVPNSRLATTRRRFDVLGAIAGLADSCCWWTRSRRHCSTVGALHERSCLWRRRCRYSSRSWWSKAASLPGQLRRPISRRRGRDGVLVHRDLGGRADGRGRAPIGTRFRPDEHLHPDRRCDRDSDRVKRRGECQHPASRERRSPHRANRWLPPDLLGARSDGAARTSAGPGARTSSPVPRTPWPSPPTVRRQPALTTSN
jgi:Major Facilitator Superfamily